MGTRFLQPILDRPGAAAPAPSNWWEAGGATGAVAVYQPKGAASLAASYDDLSGNGNNAAPGVAPTWATGTGWTFNGSSQYLDTGVVVPNDQTYSFLIRYDSILTYQRCPLFSRGAATGRDFGLYVFSNNFMYFYSGGVLPVSMSTTGGVYGVSGNQPYRNGIPSGSTIPAGSGINATSVVIGALNDRGSISLYFNGNIQALAIYNTTLTGPQVAAITTAMELL